MSKRFTETGKWDDPWYVRLPPLSKLLWNYICDKCDPAGVIDFCPELASVQIGGKVTEESMQDFGRRVRKLKSGKWHIVKFLSFQYKTIDANCRAHKHVIIAILSNGLQYPIENFPDNLCHNLSSNSDKVSDNHQETEEDTETEEEEDKETDTDKVEDW